MLPSLFSGVSGMLANQNQMDIIGNNIANANTTAFKASSANFAESFLQVAQGPSLSKPIGTAYGLGVNVSSTTTNFGQGTFQTTNVPSDLAINGDGWLTVQTAGGTNLLTRNGSFIVDKDGYFRDNNGNYLMGSMGTTVPTSPTSGYSPNKIQIPTVIGTTTEQVVSYAVGSDGTIVATGAAGSTEIVGFVTLQKYPNNNGLIDQGSGNYQYTPAAGTNQYYQAGLDGAGTLQAGALEASNTDLSSEFAHMIESQRGFEASARVITVSDSMLQTITDLKRS